ncbi:MAG: TonB-dependent vitamin B12 receptor [Gammaproteobacteria bacterium]
MIIKRFKRPVLFGLAASLVSTTLLAAEETEVLVTASRVAETVDETLASVTVITREEIEREQASSVRELLRGVAGISLANNGGAGKATSLFLRGTESDHVLVLIDGVKVGSATLGLTAFHHLPVSQIERIEIVRGPRSSLYGSEAIGGVIQIFTRRGEGEARPFFAFGMGRYQSSEITAGLSGGDETSWFNVSMSSRDSEGFNACRGNLAAGCFTIEPDEDGYRNRSVALSGGRRLDNGLEAEIRLLHAEGDTEYDGGFQNEEASVQRVVASTLRYAPDDRWQTTLNAGFSEDDAENFLNGAFVGRFKTRRESLSWQNDLSVADRHLLTVGIDYLDDRIRSTTAYGVTSRDNTGLFAQFQGQFGDHDLELSARTDDNEQFGSHATGSLAWGYAIHRDLRLTASWGTAFKAPSFNELYFPGFGNANLKPEESRSVELGISGTTRSGRWSIHLYDTRVDELIAFDSAIFAPNNISETRIRGIEASLDTRLGEWLLNTQLTLLDPENRAPGANFGNRLPRRAEESLRLSIDRRFGPYDLGATLVAVGDRYDDLANTVKLDGYATVDLRGEYRITEALRIQARIENLFDETYETAAYYNQPGRGFYLTLRYTP